MESTTELRRLVISNRTHCKLLIDNLDSPRHIVFVCDSGRTRHRVHVPRSVCDTDEFTATCTCRIQTL
jgi:hypothetical protein